MIELKNICFEQNGKQILKNINLKLDNEINVITGPNGAGKSTLAKIIMGIENPTSGSILYNGQDITDFSVTDRAKMGFSFAFQQPVRFKGLKVNDLLKIATKNNKEIALGNYLTKVGLCAKEYLPRELSGSLSGGELKRIEIASVLAKNSEINIFDEPEAGIDLWSFNNLVETFSEYQKTNNNMIVMISHQEKMIALADKIILLSGGEIIKVGKKEQVMPLLGTMLVSCNKCGVN